ncbi:MAG: class I SAM-dependent methyltransferase [Gammaproteobacteria bacterium]|nr:class I SAM-dependent methyltransferase [Gammaproteobacteria bacterium]
MVRSFDTPTAPVTRPSAWVVRHASLIPAAGPVLDLACGDGRHARYFAGRGHPVTAVDIDTSGVADLVGQPGLQIIQADLETGEWPFGTAAFAGIVITNYLHRPHFPLLPDALLPGGVLIIETFAAGNERLGRPRNPDFLLAAGELLEAFGRVLQVVAYEHGIEQSPRPAVRQRLVAVRSTAPVALPPDPA